MEKFKVSREVAILPISLYTLGFTIGPVLAAPLSELYGRRWIYWSSMPIFLAFTAIAASSNSFAVLLVFRFLATFGGSGAIAVGAGKDSNELS
jgi:MFS family permease